MIAIMTGESVPGVLDPVHDAGRSGGDAARSRARPGTVSRQPLIDRALVSGASIVSVVAPAGFGKSTLLREWAANDARTRLSITIGPYDDDPATLLQLIAEAFAAAFPDDVRFAAVATHQAPGAGPLGRMAPRLASAIAQATEPFLLMIDDLHEAASLECQDVLEVVFSGLPAGSQLVSASRASPSFLGRLRPTGEVFEIRAADLQLDASGVRAVFDGLGVAEPAAADLDRLLARTEGWPTGIVLAALVAREGRDAIGLLGDDQPVADYLYRACYAGLPEADRIFLRRTAVLEELSADCCDTVLGRADGRSRLHDLEARGLFIVPLDRTGSRYRYHQLFREFLFAELIRSEPERIRELHLAAAEWYLSHEQVSRAIDHLLAAGERERSVRLVAERQLAAYQAGERAAVRRWMSELGDRAIESFPPLMVLAALGAVLDGEPAEADRWADRLERVSYDEPAELGLPTFASGFAMLRVIMWRTGLASAVADAEYALAEEGPTSIWRDQALHLVGWVRALSGDWDAAVDAYEQASSQAVLFGNSDSILLSEAELAIIEFERGAIAEAQRHVDRALEVIEASGMTGYPTTFLAVATAARLAHRRGDPATAERMLAQVMRDRGLCSHVMPVFAVKVRLELGRAFVSLGNSSAAAHMLREIDALLRVRSDMGTLEDDVERLRDSLEQVRVVLGESPLTPAELRLLPYLQTHLTIAEIAERLFVTRNTVSSQVGSIYRKLRVGTRGAAVGRAAELGLLG
jgi:LuxR family maltose regulon positive regulatory protein